MSLASRRPPGTPTNTGSSSGGTGSKQTRPNYTGMASVAKKLPGGKVRERAFHLMLCAEMVFINDENRMADLDKLINAAGFTAEGELQKQMLMAKASANPPKRSVSMDLVNTK